MPNIAKDIPVAALKIYFLKNKLGEESFGLFFLAKDLLQLEKTGAEFSTICKFGTERNFRLCETGRD